MCATPSSREREFGRLDGRVAVVTGSSRGVGRAIALELAAGGADVLVHARLNRDAAESVADQIRSLGQRTQCVLADLENAEQHEELVEKAWSWLGGVDIWINNAGADVLTGEAAHWPFERKLEQLWLIDVVATVRLSRLVGERMRERGKSSGGALILNMGWDQAEQGMAGESGELFAATKGAVICFTRSLAQSLAPEVRVNCLAPGWIKTAWGAQASDYWQQRAVRDSLRGRWGKPEDVAQVARYLASPAADFISGQVVHINGGFRYNQ